jgi:N-formylglutamate deformylase
MPTSDPEPLIDRYFRPYARAMTEAVADRLAVTGGPSSSTCTPTRPWRSPTSCTATGPRPPVCLGTDTFHTPPELLSAAREAFAGCGEIGLDSPFIGAYVPLEFYGKEPAVGALMVELRRDST